MSTTLTTAELRAMLADAEAAEHAAAEKATADAAIADAVSAAVQRVADLTAGAVASGLSAPDLSAILAAAVDRAAPVAPEDLAAVIAPAPAGRRTRRRVARDWSTVADGSIWTAVLAGNTGRVRINVKPDGVTFTATTGNRGTFGNVSRAVQSACGDPAGAGRRGEATVNGYLALTLDGATLDGVTAAAV